MLPVEGQEKGICVCLLLACTLLDFSIDTVHNGATHSGVGLPTSFNNQDCPPQTYPWDNLNYLIPHYDFVETHKNCHRHPGVLVQLAVKPSVCPYGDGPTFSSISLAVCLVVSRFSTKAVSPRKFPDAADSRASRESSSSFSTILNSF